MLADKVQDPGRNLEDSQADTAFINTVVSIISA